MCDIQFWLGCVFLRWDFDPFLCLLWYGEKGWGRNIIVCMVDYKSNDFINYPTFFYPCSQHLLLSVLRTYIFRLYLVGPFPAMDQLIPFSTSTIGNL
jgi:hypothetical protein